MISIIFVQANRTNLKTMFRALCFTCRQHKHLTVDLVTDTCYTIMLLSKKIWAQNCRTACQPPMFWICLPFPAPLNMLRIDETLSKNVDQPHPKHMFDNAHQLITFKWLTQDKKSHSKSIKSWVCLLLTNNSTDKNDNLL